MIKSPVEKAQAMVIGKLTQIMMTMIIVKLAGMYQ